MRMMKVKIKFILESLILVIIFLYSFSSFAEGDKQQSNDKHRLKIGLALSGGGARGAAHIGVIRRLEELNIPIDYIAGTSMGAIVGGLYASGLETSEIESIILGLDWQSALKDEGKRSDRSFRRKRDDDLNLIKFKTRLKNGKPNLPKGIITGQNVSLLLSSLTKHVSNIRDFDSLNIPFRAVATNIVTGDDVVLSSGNLAKAMRASMSIPAILTPVEIGDTYLVDGGVSNNLPINVVRNMGADIVIAVDITSPLFNREQLESIVSITNQLSIILTKKNSEAQIKTLTENDILITPDLYQIEVMDFEKSAEAIQMGYVAVDSQLSKLKLLAQVNQTTPKKQKHQSVAFIDEINLINNTRLSDKLILANISINSGENFDVGQFERDVNTLYGWQLFEKIEYDIERDTKGKNILNIHITEKTIGLSYLQFGMALAEDFKETNSFNLGFAYTNPLVNRLRGEFRTGIQIGQNRLLGFEFYQPLDFKAKYFIHPKISYSIQRIPIYEGNDVIAEFRNKVLNQELSTGINLSSWGEIRAGIRHLNGNAKITIGPPDIDDLDYKNNEVFLKFSYDTLNNLNFPTQGTSASFEWLSSNKRYRSDETYDQIKFSLLTANTWGSNTLMFRSLYGTTYNGVAPFQNLFRLGGFANLSGYSKDQLLGQHYGFVSGVYLKKLNQDGFLPVYIGNSLELGNTWQSRNEMSIKNSIFAGNIFIGAESVLGSIYLAYGKAEGGLDSFYLFLGKVF